LDSTNLRRPTEEARAKDVERFRAVLIFSFAGVGLLQSMLGVYGTIAYTVTQRTFEIGIRVAFGAEKSAILLGVLEHAAKLRVVVALVLSIMLGRLVTSMLVEMQAIDPVSFGSAALLMLLTALAAAFAPGRKATHVNPMAALGAE
jgi:putative ABC transport system permease protein